jgi:rhodanese-related sulfurtransferase
MGDIPLPVHDKESAMSLDIPENTIAISVFQLQELRQTGAAHLVLDVREPDELAICAVENAVHIPMAQVASRLSDLPADRPLVVMCHHGMRSLRVVQYLRANGFDNAVNLDGGIDAWAAAIEPAIGRY